MITFRFRISVGVVPRDEFFQWAWDQWGQAGLLGVHEGTALDTGDDPTLDAAEAPATRDWVGAQEQCEAEFYFASVQEAESARKTLIAKSKSTSGLGTPGEIEEVKPQDWDAEWKASFQGVFIDPDWQILPPWVEDSAGSKQGNSGRIIRLNPGAGFGTGTHETTQLCLRALMDAARAISKHAEQPLQGMRVLDFGSGSGILAIGAALLGAKVDAVEIDPLALENAAQNAELNQVSSQIQFSERFTDSKMTQPHQYPVVLANILRPTLLEFADELVKRLAKPGVLVLSGLIEGDLAPIKARYSPLLGTVPQELSLREWRALVWKR